MAFEGKKVAQIAVEDIKADAKANGRFAWVKAKTAEITAKEENPMRAFFMLRKAYLAEFYPELLEKKKKVKKAKPWFEALLEEDE